MQPDLGQGPLALHRGHRNPEGGADFGHRQSAEETQLDDLALPRIESLQFPKRFVYAHDIDLARFVKFRGKLQAIVAAALLAVSRDRVIRQGLAHGAREDSQKMSA